MKILDCESVDSCLSSLSKILHLAPLTIVRRLITIDLENIYQNESINVTPDQYLIKRFVEEHQATTSFTHSSWFHSSRIRKGTNFQEGILPLNQVLKNLVVFIDELAQTIEPIKAIKNQVDFSHSCYHFYTKSTDSLHWGPYAYLVKQATLRPSGMSYDYLQVPEIVEDYIACRYANVYAELKQAYRANTISCIVKFTVTDNRTELIGNALYYLYLTLRGEEMNFNSNTCFDGKAESVKPDAIGKIEYFD